MRQDARNWMILRHPTAPAMSSILAIATICFRSAIRSRVVAILLAFVLLAMIGLPLSIQGDGTAAGYVRILVTYTLSAVGILLSFATLWAGCAAVSDEIVTRQIHLVLTKPVTCFQVWMGKWLGLMALNALLLLFAGITLTALLFYSPRLQELSDEQQTVVREQILMAHRVTTPTLPDVEEEVEASYQRWLRQQAGNVTVAPERVKEQLRKDQWTRALMAPPNTELLLTFSLPSSLNRAHPLYLEYQFETSEPAPLQVPHQWRAGLQGGTWQVTQDNHVIARTRHRITLPASAVDDDGTLTLAFEHSYADPITVLFSPDRGVAILTYDGPFVSNLLRALWLTLFQLSFLAALGVTTGSIFSLPVAAFSALFGLILLVFAPYIEGMADRTAYVTTGEEQKVGTQLVDTAVQQMFRGIHALVAPLQSAHAFEKLGVGEAIPRDLLLRSFVVRVLLYSGGLACLGSWLFRRREIGVAA